jgi:hypothetical protein
MGLLWEIYQQCKISQVRSEASDAARRASETKEDLHLSLRQLENKIDKLSLICRALWSFIQEQRSLTEEQLVERVKQIDLMDGQIDGKVGAKVADCPQCGRKVSSRHCLYCGADLALGSAFDSV